jgi:hypothetical protein
LHRKAGAAKVNCAKNRVAGSCLCVCSIKTGSTSESAGGEQEENRRSAPEQTDFLRAPLKWVYVEGKSRDLPPLVRDEVYKIACECLRNAFRHAQARRIEVPIRHEPRQFRLQLVDNGKGIDPAILRAGGRAGHHGLPGLHERAELAGGKLSVWSQLGSGTEIELTIPATIAYTKSPPSGQAMSAGKETGS